MSEQFDHGSSWAEQRQWMRNLSEDERANELASIARRSRLDVLDMIERAGQGHLGGDFSVLDLLTTLYHSVLDIDPTNPDAPNRDIFILSKGHAAAALYASLASVGFFPRGWLSDFLEPLSPLNGHPASAKLPGVETSTGPLGHGLPVAVGAALGQRLSGASARVFVITGDGEMQEGSNWEAIMSASHFALYNLTLIIDRNRLQQGARTEEINQLEPLAKRLAAFGWEVREVDGHDFTSIESVLRQSASDSPVAVIAHTVKGKGASFAEDRREWHHKVPTAEQFTVAREELS